MQPIGADYGQFTYQIMVTAIIILRDVILGEYGETSFEHRYLNSQV